MALSNTTPAMVQQWMDITLHELRQAFYDKKIGVTDALLQSFMIKQFNDADGNIKKVTINFLYYGRFLDMGVGRGLKAGGVRDNASSRAMSKKGLSKDKFSTRKPKKWYSRTIMYQAHRFNELIVKKYGETSLAIIEQEFKNNRISINL